MPLNRDPGKVFCGHCTRRLAEETCPGCQREVCARCADDFASCPQPRSFQYRLGIGSRLRLFSARAELGLVSTLTRRLELIDPVGHRRLAGADWSYRWSRAMKYFGAISAAGELLHARRYWAAPDAAPRARSLALADSMIELEQKISVARLDRSETAVIATTADERLVVLELAPAGERERRPVRDTRLVAPLVNRVLQAIDGDLGSGVLCAATHGELGVMRIEGAGARRVGVTPTENLDAIWVGVSGSRVALIMGERGGFSNPLPEYVLQVRDVDESLDPIYSATHRLGGSVQQDAVADISDDGRFVAVALAGRDIAVHDIERGEVQRLGGHTDAIAALRFGPGARFLASGDFDNRVIVRFRGSDGFAGPLEETALLEVGS